ncbi:MAG TPA: nucleotidyltransferase domain-containing protein [Acidobacteriota bacterium]|jgi:predicted nucleotidyltransferase|nr:nucleotidyltransferase domain-containing protein [Acidobacteriota bacterium]
MKTTHAVPLSEEILQEIVHRIVETIAPEKIILFGSAARGQMGPDSDLDFLVVKTGVDQREAVRTIRRKLVGLGLGIPKDIIVVHPEDLERYRPSTLIIFGLLFALRLHCSIFGRFPRSTARRH